MIRAGRVRVNGVVRRDPEWRVDPGRDRLEVDEGAVREAAKVYLMLNKPRGLVSTASDEQGRETVFECLKGFGLPFLSPVGRLDKASEGLLLFTNDTEWGARITDPASRVEKIYHVQVDGIPDQAWLQRAQRGVTSEGEVLAAKRVCVLRTGTRNSWLEVALMEGRNRHVRRLLEALGMSVLRLVRVAIGELRLGDLPKGAFRRLTDAEVRALSQAGGGVLG